MKQLQDRQVRDLEDIKQKILAAERTKREKWIQQKSKTIKVSRNKEISVLL